VLWAAGDRLVVNDHIFDWVDLPRAVAVFGPGVIGLELGQALHRLGVRVHVFGKGGLLGPFTDPQVRNYAVRVFQQEFYLDTDAAVTSIERTREGVSVRYLEGTSPREIAVDYVIAATGRTPNVRQLGLENTSLRLDARGVPLFDRRTSQCGDSHIFIAGDANNDVPLLHEAADEGRIAGENAARFPHVRPGLRRAPLGVVFSDPQLAVVGTRYADLDPASTVVGEVSFEDQGRSRVMLRNRGLLHVYADMATGAFLGAEMIGPDAEHIGHLLAWSLQAQLSVERMLEMPFYHPVVEEGLRTALRDAKAKLDAADHRQQPLAA
jgi:dihydrolipoamide dehydrogenase